MAAPASSWLDVFDDDDRASFFSELDHALDVTEASVSAEPLETCLAAWRRTAEALSDPETRAILTSPLSGEDFGEVPRPA